MAHARCDYLLFNVGSLLNDGGFGFGNEQFDDVDVWLFVFES